MRLKGTKVLPGTIFQIGFYQAGSLPSFAGGDKEVEGFLLVAIESTAVDKPLGKRIPLRPSRWALHMLGIIKNRHECRQFPDGLRLCRPLLR